ncbi:MAG: hypothetical protein HY941_12250 [Gammaproteobacteria bacterium]|nr:hypothetical protein [Gammaproteobacteria bacterium]
MTTTQINLLATALLATQAVILFGLAHHNQSKRHLQAFLIFWSGVCLTTFFYYLLAHFSLSISKTWVGLTLDTANNFMLAFCAYALFRGDAFNWSDKFIKIGWGLFLAEIVATITVGVIVPTEDPIWKMFNISPNTLMAAISLLAVGIGLFREPTAHAVRWAALILFGLYAFLQFPGYYFRFVGMTPEAEESNKIISMFLAAGKFSVFIMFIAIPLSITKENEATKFVRSMQILTSLLVVGFTLFVLFFRVFQSVELVTKPLVSG